MQTAKELFIHELNDIFDAEQKLVEALGEQEEANNLPALKQAFSMHRLQTEGQVERLQQVFEELGEEPEGEECKGIKGLIEERTTIVEEEDPSEDLLAIIDVGAAIKVESYEINAYTGLISLAEELGLKKAVRLLTQNMKEEQQTLKKMQQFEKKLKPENLGMEEEEMEEQEASSRRTQKKSAKKASRGTKSRSRRAA